MNNFKQNRSKHPKKRYQDESHYDPRIHVKTKGGWGFGMKRGAKPIEYENSGINLASLFGWEVPENLKHIKEIIDKRNGKS